MQAKKQKQRQIHPTDVAGKRHFSLSADLRHYKPGRPLHPPLGEVLSCEKKHLTAQDLPQKRDDKTITWAHSSLDGLNEV